MVWTRSRISAGGYNIAPSAPVPVVRRNPTGRLAVCHWGFIPHWVKEPVLKPINARAETLDQQTVLPGCVQTAALPGAGQRLLRVARGAGREAAFFHSDGGDGSVFLCGTLVGLAGAGRAGGELRHHHHSGKEALRDIHDRMPVIIAPEDYDAWLEAGGQGLLKPSAGGDGGVSRRQPGE